MHGRGGGGGGGGGGKQRCGHDPGAAEGIYDWGGFQKRG